MINYVDGTGGNTGRDSQTAGRYLKATSGWYNSGNGQDTYGFAALPGVSGTLVGNVGNVGNNGYWWSATEIYANFAYYRHMYYYYEYAKYNYAYKSNFFSIRCVQD